MDNHVYCDPASQDCFKLGDVVRVLEPTCQYTAALEGIANIGYGTMATVRPFDLKPSLLSSDGTRVVPARFLRGFQ